MKAWKFSFMAAETVWLGGGGGDMTERRGGYGSR